MLPPYRMTFNRKLDRLSSLIDRLKVDVAYVAIDEVGEADVNFRVYQAEEGTLRLVFRPRRAETDTGVASIAPKPNEKTLVAASISVSGIGRQLITALPQSISVPLAQEPCLQAVVSSLIEEAMLPRCGGQAAFQRLCEVVVIRLLRRAMVEPKELLNTVATLERLA